MITEAELLLLLGLDLKLYRAGRWFITDSKSGSVSQTKSWEGKMNVDKSKQEQEQGPHEDERESIRKREMPKGKPGSTAFSQHRKHGFCG